MATHSTDETSLLTNGRQYIDRSLRELVWVPCCIWKGQVCVIPTLSSTQTLEFILVGIKCSCIHSKATFAQRIEVCADAMDNTCHTHMHAHTHTHARACTHSWPNQITLQHVLWETGNRLSHWNTSHKVVWQMNRTRHPISEFEFNWQEAFDVLAHRQKLTLDDIWQGMCSHRDSRAKVVVKGQCLSLLQDIQLGFGRETHTHAHVHARTHTHTYYTTPTHALPSSSGPQ